MFYKHLMFKEAFFLTFSFKYFIQICSFIGWHILNYAIFVILSRYVSIIELNKYEI